MCGIVGVTGERIAEARLRDAVGVLRHRGPDDSGYHFDADGPVALGHSRLAIIDPDGGRQPLFSADGDIVLVCNGEIYGFEAIRDELTRLGHHFRTGTDAEVIIGLYLEYGMEFLGRLRGEFAFLLHDRRRHSLLAVRDRFGIKPLFYARTGQGMVFASEAKGIFATGLVRPQLHLPAIRDMRAEAWVDSLFVGIEAVLPGGYVRVDTRTGEAKAHRYWELALDSLDSGEDEQPFEHYRRGVAELLDEAVRLRLRADVPVGVALSGGLDSSAVAGLVRRHFPGELHTFCITFPDHPAINEADIARRTADFLGSRHHEVVADTGSLLGVLEDSIWHSESATPSLNGAGRFLLARHTARFVKVVLSGEGSDEVFLGYDYFRPQPLRTRLLRCILMANPADVHPCLRPLLKTVRWLQRQPYQPRHHSLLAATPRGDGSLHHQERRRMAPRGNRILRAQYFSLRGRLLSYILTIGGDRPEMAHGLEARQPLLDHRLFEFARTIPLRWRMLENTEKYVLREAVRGRVTNEIQRRRKFGYRAPQPAMVAGSNPVLDGLIGRYLSVPAIRAAGIYRPGWIRLLSWARPWLSRSPGLARQVDRFLFYVMTVHILHSRFLGDTQTAPAGRAET